MLKAKLIVAMLPAVVLVSPLYPQSMMDCGMHKGAGHSSSHQQKAQSMMDGHEGGCPMMSGKSTLGFYLENKDKLKLTDEQVESLHSLSSSLDAVLSETGDRVHKANQEIQSLLDQPNITHDELEAKVKATENHFTDLRLANLAAELHARQLLTSEQWEKAKSLRKAGDGNGGCGMMKGKKREEQKIESHDMHHR